MPNYSSLQENEKDYGDEGMCAYNDCKQEPEWTRLADHRGPGRVFVCELHRNTEGTYDDKFGLSKYTAIPRDPAESKAVIAHLLKAVARG